MSVGLNQCANIHCHPLCSFLWMPLGYYNSSSHKAYARFSSPFSTKVIGGIVWFIYVCFLFSLVGGNGVFVGTDENLASGAVRAVKNSF